MNFRRMITPRIIQVLFVIGIVVIALGVLFALITGLGMIFTGWRGEKVVGILLFIGAIPGGAIWMLLWRVSCELWVVIFAMNETLTDIRNLLRERSSPGRLPQAEEPLPRG